MGVPLIPIGLALSAIGTGMGIYASESAKNKMNQRTQEELGRQSQFRGQSGQQFQQSLAQSQPQAVQTQLQQGQSRLGQALAATQAVPLATSATPSQTSTTSQVVADPGTRALAEQSDVAATKLGAYPEFTLQQSIKNLRAAQQQGLIGTEAQASQSVLPLELQAAQQSTQGLSGIGSLLGTAGGLASTYGAMQAARGAQLGSALGGVTNLASLPAASQNQYSQMYNYYNNPYMAGWQSIYNPNYTAPKNPYQ